jgi:hypothetical protein
MPSCLLLPRPRVLVATSETAEWFAQCMIFRSRPTAIYYHSWRGLAMVVESSALHGPGHGGGPGPKPRQCRRGHHPGHSGAELHYQYYFLPT